MKKTATILLSLFYLVLTTDVSVAIHKCMGSVQSVSIIQNGETCCCGDFNSDGCCENETVDFPEESENKVPSSYQFNFEKSLAGTIELPTEELIENVVKIEYKYDFHSLAPPRPEAVYLLYCSLTYYG